MPLDYEEMMVLQDSLVVKAIQAQLALMVNPDTQDLRVNLVCQGFLDKVGKTGTLEQRETWDRWVYLARLDWESRESPGVLGFLDNLGRMVSLGFLDKRVLLLFLCQ